MARIPYDFTPFPRKLHPGWAGRSHASWGLCVRLWLLADGQPIQVHGADWRASLCQQMGIGGRDRPTTRALMADLQSDGLMTVAGGFVHVKFHPDQGRPGTTELRTELVAEEYDRGSTGVQPGVRQESYPSDLSVEKHSGRVLQTDRQTDRIERERGGDALEGAALVTWILNDHYRRYHDLLLRPPAGLKRRPMAEQLAEWVEGASGAYGLSNQALATKILAGLFASSTARDAGYSLTWAVQSPEEFCGLPDGSALPARKPSKEAAEASQNAALTAKAAKIRADYSARIKQARDSGDQYTPDILAAERDQRLSRLQAS